MFLGSAIVRLLIQSDDENPKWQHQHRITYILLHVIKQGRKESSTFSIKGSRKYQYDFATDVGDHSMVKKLLGKSS